MEKKDFKELLIFELARRRAYTFLTQFCLTVDERSGQVKPFPSMGKRKICTKCKLSFDLSKEEKKSLSFGKCPQCESELQVEFAYLKMLIDTWQDNKNVLIPKSRQMMISWTMVACHLWLAMFHPNTFIIFQSETEEKAKELIKRTKDIWNRLPEFIKAYCPLEETPSQTQFKWKNGSRIRSVPQGPTQVTGLTPSAVFSDEMGIQEESETTYYETRPALAGGGRFTGVGTPNGKEFFWRLVTDKLEGDLY